MSNHQSPQSTHRPQSFVWDFPSERNSAVRHRACGTAIAVTKAYTCFSSHQRCQDTSKMFHTKGYLCPRCQSVYCDLPVECRICGLLLVESPHLARSFHHLFPLKPFEEAVPEIGHTCAGCQAALVEQVPAYQCPDCQQLFCFDCDTYMHEVLHNCSGCN